MKKFVAGLLVAFGTMTMSGCMEMIGENKMETVSGEVYYLQRISLPSNANVTVTLSDVSLADAPAKVISSQSFATDGQQVPIPFTLTYPANDIDSRSTYSVSAKIDVDGKMIYNSVDAYPVITDANKTASGVRVQVFTTDAMPQ